MPLFEAQYLTQNHALRAALHQIIHELAWPAEECLSPNREQHALAVRIAKAKAIARAALKQPSPIEEIE